MILASQSPRRRELLSLVQHQFQVRPADIDETLLPNELAREYVRRLAKEKAMVVAAMTHQTDLVIGADTSVSIDGLILNKPHDFDDFLRMMKLLSGKTHQVYTGICVAIGPKLLDKVVRTDVTFRESSVQERIDYWKSGEAKDKAGGYGIQGLAARFVASIHGSYTNVVGLPLVELEDLIRRAT